MIHMSVRYAEPTNFICCHCFHFLLYTVDPAHDIRKKLHFNQSVGMGLTDIQKPCFRKAKPYIVITVDVST